MTIIFFDTETTGLPQPECIPLTKQPYIIEFAAIKCDNELKKIDEFHCLINPQFSLPQNIIKITGLTDDILKNEKPFAANYLAISKFFLNCDTMVAHNVAFDRQMLAIELARCDVLLNFPWPIKHICTVEQTYHIKNKRLSLGDLYEYLFQEKIEGAHRAMNDVKALWQIYQLLNQ